MSSAFDRCLENQELFDAAAAYASRRGSPDSRAYRAAWFDFRRRIRSREDLRRWRSGPMPVNRDLVEVFKAAIERAMEIDEVSMATAQLLDPHMADLRLVAHSGFAHEFVDYFNVVDDSSTPCGRALASGKPVLVPDIRHSTMFGEPSVIDVILDAGAIGVASLPVSAPDGRLLGMVSTHHDTPARWSNRQMTAFGDLRQATGRVLQEVMRTKRTPAS